MLLLEEEEFSADKGLLESLTLNFKLLSFLLEWSVKVKDESLEWLNNCNCNAIEIEDEREFELGNLVKIMRFGEIS